ncbi:hypothetical protein M427DRAFT_364327 [Gonapodya prolifera JEL478]|uniref:Uncharacterized protein n=1 Tax=Gonapodya prolifera (strain JEL478) TaxID=1344416 RepID=A0A139A9Q9_GONPJ|nr:hypothetical protein M427DRAFT_364327 [Gonapodya prolifera JEL478]|eukprot:KXS13571.1 hypothetical protein M427DRAFT_364327 [Gonapodya prolifera JEL478]
MPPKKASQSRKRVRSQSPPADSRGADGDTHTPEAPYTPTQRVTRSRAAAAAALASSALSSIASSPVAAATPEPTSSGHKRKHDDDDEQDDNSDQEQDDREEDEEDSDDDDDAPEAVSLSAAKVTAISAAKSKKAELEKAAIALKQSRRDKHAAQAQRAAENPSRKAKKPVPTQPPAPAKPALAPLPAHLLASLASQQPSSTATSASAPPTSTTAKANRSLDSVDPLGLDLDLTPPTRGGHMRFSDIDAADAGAGARLDGELRTRHSRLDDVDLGDLVERMAREDAEDDDESDSSDNEGDGIKVYGADGDEEGDSDEESGSGSEEDLSGADEEGKRDGKSKGRRIKRRKVLKDGSVKVGTFIARPLPADRPTLPSAPFLRLPSAPSAAAFLPSKLLIDKGKTPQQRTVEMIEARLARRGAKGGADGAGKEQGQGFKGRKTKEEKKKEAKKAKRDREKEERRRVKEERGRVPALLALTRPLVLTSRLPLGVPSAFVSRPGGIAALPHAERVNVDRSYRELVERKKRKAKANAAGGGGGGL